MMKVKEKHDDRAFPLSVHLCQVDETKGLIPHFHDDFEILYVISGKIEFRIGSYSYTAGERSLLFSNMLQIHSATIKDSNCGTFYAIVFDRKIFEEVNINKYYIDFIQPFYEGKIRFPAHIKYGTELHNEIQDSVKLIIDESNSRKTAYEVYIESAIKRIFAAFARNGDVLADCDESNCPSQSIVYIERVYEYIKKNYDKRIRLMDMAAYLNIDKHYLCRIIKSITGRSFTEFLNIYRVKQAMCMLRNSNKTVIEVAQRSGFNNLSYFNRVFLRYTGKTPSITRTFL